MGASFSCVFVGGPGSREGSVCSSPLATLSPVHTLRRKSSQSLTQPATGASGSLMDACLRAVVDGLLRGRIGTQQVHDLPHDLIQLVVDRLVQQDALTLGLAQRLVCPGLHHLHLDGLTGVCKDWLPAIAGARHLASLNLSGAALTDASMGWLTWLSGLRVLRLQHCTSLTDSGLAVLRKLAALHTLDLSGCDTLTSACLAPIGSLTGLTALELGQCFGLTGHGLGHLSGLSRLQRLSLGWCPSLGDTRSDPANCIAPLVQLAALTHLNLGGTKVSDGQARLVLPGLTRLQELDLSQSSITGAGLPALRPMAGSLRVLRLRGCRLSDSTGPAALACLSRLQSLDLSCSSISNAGLLQLSTLRALTELQLDMCHIGDEGCRVFRHLTSLQLLDLSDTDVSEAGVTCLGACRRLRCLSLCNTEVGDSAATTLAGLTCLTCLNLDGRGISDACLPLLLPLGGRLLELDLSGARISARGAACLAAGFTALQSLDVCGGHITDRACLELAKLRRLRHLNIAQNRGVGDIGINLLASGLAASLESLNVSYTSVTDACLPWLTRMQALETAVVSYTGVSEAGAARLRAARPSLVVKSTCRKSSGSL